MESPPNSGIITPDQALVAPNGRSLRKTVKWQRDPALNDLINYFDEDRFFAKKIKTDADRFGLLNTQEIEAIAAIARKCQEDFTYAARNFFYITTEKREERLLVLKESQMLIYEHMLRLRDKGMPMKIILIKARRLGASTLCEAMIAWKTMFFKNVNAIVVSFDPAHAAYLFGMMQFIYDRMPWWLKPMCSSRKFEDGLIFENPNYDERRANPGLGSQVMVQAANKRTGVGQGVRITAGHLCFAPETLVITADNTLRPITEVGDRDLALSSSGAMTRVVGVHLSQRRNEETAQIRPWGSPFPMATTLDHRVLTPTGYRQAGEIKKGDWLRLPVRPIEGTVKSVYIAHNPTGGDPVNRQKYVKTQEVQCGYDFGWLCGLYLAEGCIAKNKKLAPEHQVYRLFFGIDCDEEVDVLAAIGRALGTSHKVGAYRHKKSRTVSLTIGNSGLARFIHDNFGHTETKRVPDWAWSAGEDFCRGLLVGYFYGDGHVGQGGTASVPASSIRSAISVGMRALGASLGLGWGTLYNRKAGFHYGRNCKEIWTLMFNGQSAVTLSKWMEKSNGSRCRQKTSGIATKWRYSDDQRFIDIQVREVSRGFSEEFYDLEVASKEHNFCTLQACVANSEFSDWNQNYARDLIEADLGPALAEEDPSMFCILESTAKGTGNYSYDLWNKNVELGDQAEWHPVFLPWFFESTRFLPPTGGWRPEPEEATMRERIELDWTRCDNQECLQYHERYRKTLDISGDPCPTCKTGKLSPYVLTDGQLVWMQRKRKNAAKDEESRKALLQEQASTAESAFQSSGTSIFSESSQAFAASTVRQPIKEGFFDKVGKLHGCNPYDERRNPITNQMYQACYLPGCNADHEIGNGRGENPVKIWKEPERGAKYCIGADIAEGYGGKSDYSAACVLKINQSGGPDEQVAVFRSNTTSTIEFAQVLNCLGRWYNEALLAPENNMFDTTVNELRYRLAYPQLYRMKSDAVASNQAGKYGWRTQSNSKPRLYQTWNQRLGERLIIVRYRKCVEEMKTFVKDFQEGVKTGAVKGSNDDMLMASMIAFYVAHENDWDENLGQLGSKQELTMEAAPWHWECQGCKLEWPAIDATEKQCPRCGCRVIQGRLNRDVTSEDGQSNPFINGSINRYQAQEYAEPMVVQQDESQILDYEDL